MQDGAGRLEVVDADGHVQEPGDLWERYIDKRFYPYRPIIDPVATDNMMVVAGRVLPRITLPDPHNEDYRSVLMGGWNATFGDEFAKGPNGFSPQWYLEEMDREGIDRMVLFPSRGLYACAVDDLDGDLANAITLAYNQWLADFCSTDPHRLVAVALSSLHDPAGAADQLRYCARQLGCVAAMIRPNPVQGRNLDHSANDAFWGAAEELGIAVATHEGTGVWMKEYGPDRFASRLAQHAMSHVVEAMQAVYCFTIGGILERFPALRVGFLEAGGTWLAPWLYRLDEHAEQLQDVPSETGRISKRPSSYFREQCWTSCEPDEPNVGGLFEYAGADRIMWASDFPHPDAKYPGLVKGMMTAMASSHVGEADIARYAGANARAFYRI